MLRCARLAQQQCCRVLFHPRGACTGNGLRRRFGSQDASAVDEINSELEQLLGSLGGDPLSTPSTGPNLGADVAVQSPGRTQHVSGFEDGETPERGRAQQTQQQQHQGDLPAAHITRAILNGSSAQSHGHTRLNENVNSAVSLVERANRVFCALGDHFSEAVYHRALEVR